MESHSLPHLKSGAADWRDTSQPAHVPVMSGSNARVVWRSEITECVPSHFPEAEEHKASGANPDPNRARRPGYQLLLLRAGRPCFSRAADPAAASCAPTASMTFNAPAGSAATGTG